MSTELQARSTALLEEIKSQVKVIAEGHGGLAERIDDTDARLIRIERRFDELEIRVVRSARQPRRTARRPPRTAKRPARGTKRDTTRSPPGGATMRRKAS